MLSNRMFKHKLIGFTGKMGVGKSTCIELLSHMNKVNIHNVKLAKPLYDMQEFIYRRISKVYTRPEDFVKDRKLLQWIGTEWGRDTVDTNLWVKVWQKDVEEVYRLFPRHIVVCDDVRYDNEAVVVRELGGVVVQVTSGKAHERINTLTGINNHVSESGIDKGLISYTISNDGTVDELRSALLEMNSKLKIW